MLDRPDAATLLKAMASTLTEEVLPSTSGGTRHAVRVVANLCLILEREVIAGPSAAEETRQALAELLDRDATLPELVADLDRALRDSDSSDAQDAASFESRVREVILADVERRLAIDRPGYAS
ncbi:MAG: hypothetical protein JRE71_18195 [Deltaproteobacteria bacterium]|nr:hypothetical protein [Deltaproteobacteria bacterium]